MGSLGSRYHLFFVSRMSGSLYGESKVKEKEKDKKSHDFLALSVPFSSILFVDRRDKLQLCWEAIAKV